MPTLGVNRDDLFEALGKTYTDEEFDELCFEFGIELDDITSEAEELEKSGVSAAAAATAASTAIVYKIDIPANRYDLLCLEGLSRALRVFLGKEEAPTYRLREPAGGARQRMVVKADTARVRPYVVCAVLRGVSFDDKSYKSFMDLQEKLHQNICRRRTLVAIGTHDLGTLRGPFTYEALPPGDIEFVPLTPADQGAMDAASLLEFYDTDASAKHLKPFTNIIKDSEVYPVLYDADRVVLSLPPIINGHHSKITLETTDVFIECTAVDKTKANIVLDTMVTMFSQYCSDKFCVEPVDVVYEAMGSTETTPLLSCRAEEACAVEICSYTGVEIAPEEICRLCTKMQLGPAEVVKGGGDGGGKGAGPRIRVTVPPTRSDILHAVDIIEDVAIAYGFNRIPPTVPATYTVGGSLAVNTFTDLLRGEISRAGYTEILTHGLCSKAENFTMLRRKEAPCVSLLNPAMVEYEVVRTSLLPGALKTAQHNKAIPVKDGVRLFEISDVVLKDAKADTGCRNVRRLLALFMGPSAGFEVIHGLVDRVMALVQIQPSEEYAAGSVRASEGGIDSLGGPWRAGMQYSIAPKDRPAFFERRCADVILEREGRDPLCLGSFGILHPQVLQGFELTNPCSAVEMDLEPLM